MYYVDLQETSMIWSVMICWGYLREVCSYDDTHLKYQLISTTHTLKLFLMTTVY